MYEVRYGTRGGWQAKKFRSKDHAEAKDLAKQLSVIYGKACMIDNKLNTISTWRSGCLREEGYYNN